MLLLSPRLLFIALAASRSVLASGSLRGHHAKRQAHHRDLAARDNTSIEDRARRSCSPTYTNSVTINGPVLPKPTTFVKRSGNIGFSLNGKAWRPVGANVYWLGLDENPVIAYPDQGRVREAMAMVTAMGGNTVRCTSCGVSVGNSLSIWPAPNQNNEAAFKVVDYAIAAASKYGIRLVIPLVDDYQYYTGGKYTFLNWAGASTANNGAAFYTDANTISLYQHYITNYINRVNSITGVRYGDDPTIFAWETGNELGAYQLKEGAPPPAWTNAIASTIKSVAQQLVLDGSDGLYTPANGVRTAGLSVAPVDLASDHAYPPNSAILSMDYSLANKYKKGFIMGEYDWTGQNGGTSLSSWFSSIEKGQAAGDFFWSLFGHDASCCNYVQHNDNYSMYYPNGNSATLQKQILLVVQHFYRMTGRSAPSSLPAVKCPQPAF